MSLYRKYGWKPDVPDFRDCRLEHVSEEELAALPKKVDLSDGMPSVWDQGDLGSCTAHGIGAVVEYEQKKIHPKWDFSPSRLFIYYNERSIEGTVGQDAGALIRDGIKSVATLGVCKETLWPYVTTKFTEKPPVAAYANATIHHAVSYARVPQTIASIKKTLAGGSPFVFGFSVYESFESQEVAKTGILPMPSSKEKMLGGHAVCACGYDDADETILVRNSWGPEWGIRGYFKMPYAYILDNNLVDDLWAITKMQ